MLPDRVSNPICRLGRRGSGEGAGTTEPRLEEYCVHSLFRMVRVRVKNRELYNYYRIYPKMEHPISRRNDKPCRPSLQSDFKNICREATKTGKNFVSHGMDYWLSISRPFH